MSKVELYEDIRRARRDEVLSIRELAKRFRVHRRDVRLALNGAEPLPRAAPSGRVSPVTGAWRDWIRGVLVEDQKAPVKQRHTAKRIGERLAAEHGVVVSESRMRSLVAELRAELVAPRLEGVMVSQEHPPGAEAEVDWGEFVAIIAGVTMKLQLFVMRLSHSRRGFHRAYAHMAQESWLDGHVRAFTRFGGVPHRIRYDNLKTAVTRILTGRDRVENDRFIALRSHYLFDSFFCRPGLVGAHEKGGVEGEVRRFRRSHLTPVPVFDSLAELNAFLAACDDADDARFVIDRSPGPGAGSTVAQLGVADRAAMGPLPGEVFATATRGTARVDAKARICVRQCFYSVPARLVGTRVAFDLHADHLIVWDGEVQVAAHARALHRRTVVLDIDHYLEVLTRKPGAMPGSTALAQARSRGVFTVAHQRFWDLARRRHGDAAGTRAICEVLLLHRHHPHGQVLVGLAAALAAGSTDPAVVAVEVRRAAENPAPAPTDLGRDVPGAHRPLPTLGAYDTLLTSRKDIPA